jgi:transcription elongation factor Elf1
MTFQSYLDSGGEECPKCGAKAIKASAPQEKIKAGKGKVSMLCTTCGARGRDIYNLSKSEDL